VSTSADDLLQVTSDISDDVSDAAASVQLTSSATWLSTTDPLEILSVSTTPVDLQSSVIVLSADHTYHHASKWQCLNSESDVTDELQWNKIQRVQYVERRRKNNVASKRSRETRKRQLTNMEEEAVRLEQENIRLKQRVMELERMTQTMKSALMDALRQS